MSLGTEQRGFHLEVTAHSINVAVSLLGLRGNWETKDALSPKLMQLPAGAFSGFFGSALMPPNEEAAGAIVQRLCRGNPALSFAWQS